MVYDDVDPAFHSHNEILWGVYHSLIHDLANYNWVLNYKPPECILILVSVIMIFQ